MKLCFSAQSAGIAEADLVESVIPCHDAQVVRLHGISSFRVRILHYCATTTLIWSFSVFLQYASKPGRSEKS